jgi:calcineurin-like phosphoesterase family protein
MAAENLNIMGRQETFVDCFSLLYLTDSHTGNDGTGWGQHPIRPDLLPQVIAALRQRMTTCPVDMILHGGDITDTGSVEQQLQVKKLWSQLPASIRLCLGNHDLDGQESPKNWLANVPEFFEDSALDYMIECGQVDVYVLACGWLNEHDKVTRWSNPGYSVQPGILPTQLEWLAGLLKSRSHRPAIMAIHAPLDPLPPTLTGQEEPIHLTEPSYTQPIINLLNQSPNVKLVLSGHCHATCLTRHGNRVHLTTSAFCEPPFQIREITIEDNMIRVRSINPVDYEQLQVVCHSENLWSFGKDCDLTVNIPINKQMRYKY